MEKYIESLFDHVRQSSTDFADRMAAVLPSIKPKVGSYSNAAFLLRAYVSFVGDADEELAVSIDIMHHPDGTISIETDICTDDGTIVADGPSARFSAANLNSASSDAVNAWQKKFELFLRASEPLVLAEVSKLLAPQEKLVRRPTMG